MTVTAPDRYTAERIVIGACLATEGSRFRAIRVRPDDFTDRQNHAVYAALEELWSYGREITPEAVATAATIDLATVTAYLDDAPKGFIQLDEAILTLIGHAADVSPPIAAGATFSRLARRIAGADETTISRTELAQVIAGYYHEIEEDDRRRSEHREQAAAARAERDKSPWMQISDTEIDFLAKDAYARGTHPIEWAEFLASMRIDVNGRVSAARAADPTAFPGYVVETTADAAGRAIVGALLDAGWQPPTLPADTATGGQP